jgi:perosamine synthetase
MYSTVDECVSKAEYLLGHPDDLLGISLEGREIALQEHTYVHRARSIISAVVHGHISAFSFYGNKIITTGEGGMVTTNDDVLAARVRQTKRQGMDPQRRYWFTIVGYNYRMTNIEAAIGLAQLENVDWHIARRRAVAEQYRAQLSDVSGICLQPEMPWAKNVYWMPSLVLNEDMGLPRDTLCRVLAESGIETRPFFFPIHSLPMYESPQRGAKFPVAESLARRGLNLPSSALLSAQDVEFICASIRAALPKAKRL